MSSSSASFGLVYVLWRVVVVDLRVAVADLRMGGMLVAGFRISHLSSLRASSSSSLGLSLLSVSCLSDGVGLSATAGVRTAL